MNTSAQGLPALQFKEEIKIPVPWGHLSAKVWGPDDGHPVLALHGWLDNAGTFDNLAPLLPSNLRLVCLDFCGHGLSSPYPPGMFLNYYDHIYHIKLAIDHLKWEKVILLGHSMGAIASLLFAAVYPNLVEKLISLDIVKQMSSHPMRLPKRLNLVLGNFQEISSKMDQPPRYFTYKDARERFVLGYNGSITDEDADILLIRGLAKKSDDEFYFTRDLRNLIRPYLFTDFTTEQLREFAKALTCPLLIIKANTSEQLTYEKKLNEEFLEIYKATSSDFRFVVVEGTHHVHLSNPSHVAPHIIDFIRGQVKSKL